MASANLFAKLFKVQQELPTIPKTATNPHFKSKYADLPTIMESIKPLLAKYNLLLLQPLQESPSPDVLAISTTIVDVDNNETFSTMTTVPIGPNKTPQAFGSAITYARRYALSSMLGIITDEDDDGNASSVKATVKVSKSDVITLYATAAEHGYSKQDILDKLKTKGIFRADQLTPEMCEKFIQWIIKNPKKD
jgi:hypothetical protein